MTDTPADPATVTYLDAGDVARRDVCHAVVAGADVEDPETGVAWMPIARPDGELTLLDPALVVDGSTTAPHAVDVLASALAVLAHDMSEVDERVPGALRTARLLIVRFIAGTAPIERTVQALADANPRGGLSVVLGGLDSAVEQLDLGHLGDSTADIVAANFALAELLVPGPGRPHR
ncbi:MAG TPA: hypothetical protein VGN81_40190 [Pseudonocardiaceae bacterium]|jgi:hypothetical protein